MIKTDSSESQDPVKDVGAAGRGRRVVWAVVGLIFVGLLGASVVAVAGPKPCGSCHDRGAFRAQTSVSAHASVECERCHLSPGFIGKAVFMAGWPTHAYLSAGGTADRDAANVPDSRCKSCHDTALQDVVVSKGIRMNHPSCASKASCTDCHSNTAHGSTTRWVRSYEMDGCLDCHRESNKVACNLCHEGQAATTRIKSITFSATHGPAWQSTHGMGDIATCSVCHAAGDCATCHGPGVPHESNFVAMHASHASKPDAKCASCHEGTFCGSCHGTEMPHPAGFTQRHPAAAKKEPDVCKRCHEDSDCTDCHLKHVHPGGAIGTAVSAGGGK